MPFIDKYEYGFTDPFTIAGREEAAQDIGLTANPAVNSGRLQGTVTSGGAPVQDATVKLFDLHDNPVDHANTGGQGQFTISNIPAGSYSVVAVKEFFLLPQSTPVAIQQNQTTTVAIELAPNTEALTRGAIFGTISDQITGLHIPGVSITLFANTTPSPTELGTVTTNAQGQYVIYMIVPGQYFVVADKLGFQSKQSAPIDIAAQSLAALSVQLAADPQSDKGTISGFIRDAATSLPVADAFVALYSVTDGVETIVKATKSSNGGRYLFGQVGAGTYKVKATIQEEA